MGKLSKREQHSGPVRGFSNSGNPIINRGDWDKRVVVIIEENSDISKGDILKFTIQKDHSDHYQAAIVGEGGSKVSKPDYSSSPNVPIHHDGKYGESVGDTRSKKKSFKSPDEREFDPKTHGAPEAPSQERERSFLRQDK